MNYVEYDFTITPTSETAAEILVAELAEVGFESFVDTERGLLAYVQEPLWHKDILNEIYLLQNSDYHITYSYKTIQQVNWNEEWEKNFSPITVGDLCTVRAYLHGRPVVFVNGCRNMWVMTQHETRRYLREIGARYVGFIELHDKAPNLVSVLTIIRWLFYGRKEATRLLPAAGVSQRDVADADRFGLILLRTLYDGQWEQLQERLMREGAVTFIPQLYFIERNGYRMWGRWAHFVRHRGGPGDPRRQGRLRLFKAYLFFVLYAVSPFGLLFYGLTYPLRRATLKRAQREVCYELS